MSMHIVVPFKGAIRCVSSLFPQAVNVLSKSLTKEEVSQLSFPPTGIRVVSRFHKGF